MELLLIVVLLLQGLVFGFFCRYIANDKGRDGGSWFLLGFCFSFLAVLALIAVSRREAPSLTDSAAATTGGRSSSSGTRTDAKFAGKKELLSDAYKVWLVDHYQIKKIEVLGKYFVADKLYNSIDEALAAAHALEMHATSQGMHAISQAAAYQGPSLEAASEERIIDALERTGFKVLKETGSEGQKWTMSKGGSSSFAYSLDSLRATARRLLRIN